MGIGQEIETAVEAAAPQVGIPVLVLKILGALFIAAVLGFVVWKVFFAEHTAQEKSKAVETQAAIGKGDAGAAAGHDAIQITVDNSKAAAGIDAAVREALRAISKTKGADQKLDPTLDAAGRNAICMRPSAASLPDCQHLQHPGP